MIQTIFEPAKNFEALSIPLFLLKCSEKYLIFMGISIYSIYTFFAKNDEILSNVSHSILQTLKKMSKYAIVQSQSSNIPFISMIERNFFPIISLVIIN